MVEVLCSNGHALDALNLYAIVVPRDAIRKHDEGAQE